MPEPVVPAASPEIAVIIHATERSILDTGAPPYDQIAERMRAVATANGGQWLGVSPRVIKVIRTGNFRAWETHASWVYVWPDTEANRIARASLTQRLRNSVAQMLLVGDSDWVVEAAPYSPRVNGSVQWWESGAAAQTRTRDQFATMTGRLDPDENPTGPTTPETHPTAPGEAAEHAAKGADKLLEALTLMAWIGGGAAVLWYAGPIITAATSWIPTKKAKNVPARSNPRRRRLP